MFDSIKRIDQRVAKKVLLFAALVIITVGAIMIILDWMSYKNINFKLSNETKSITVYDSENYELYSKNATSAKASGSLNESGTLRLKAGAYYVLPTGNNISTDTIELNIDSSKDVDINPYYSQQYLSEKLSGEIPTINNVITDKYKNIIDGYDITDGDFYHYGDWYGTLLEQIPDRGSSPDTYGIILHKVNGSWQIAATPQIVFRYDDHKDIPSDIINTVNQAVSGL